jgi:hypothetical protein
MLMAPGATDQTFRICLVLLRTGAFYRLPWSELFRVSSGSWAVKVRRSSAPGLRPRLRFRSEMDERCDMLLPTVSDDTLGVTFFAALLPWETGLVSLQGLDADGHVLPP